VLLAISTVFASSQWSRARATRCDEAIHAAKKKSGLLTNARECRPIAVPAEWCNRIAILHKNRHIPPEGLAFGEPD
jgi:hypothetical protein